MTFEIPVGSLKHDRAIRFGRELERAMKARNVGSRTLADGAGCGRSAIRAWQQGRVLPRIEMARRLAAALDWPRLATLGVGLRTKRCPIDERPFTDDSGSDNRVYCGPSCQRLAEKKRMGSTIDKRAANAERRLTIHRRAVEAYCAGCEPEGRCVTADCPLRPVSPLPLFEHRLDLVPVSGGRKPLSEQDRAARGLITAGSWSRYTPEARQARIDRAADASKRARGLVPA